MRRPSTKTMQGVAIARNDQVASTLVPAVLNGLHNEALQVVAMVAPRKKSIGRGRGAR